MKRAYERPQVIIDDNVFEGVFATWGLGFNLTNDFNNSDNNVLGLGNSFRAVALGEDSSPTGFFSSAISAIRRLTRRWFC